MIMQQRKTSLINDLTVGSVPKTLLSFAMPLFLSGLLQTVYNMVDMIVVGNVVGPKGLAAVSIGGDFLMILTFIAMGFSNAGQILISRFVGENRSDKIHHMIGTLFTLLFSLAIIVTIFSLLFYRNVLTWLHTPEESFSMAVSYVVTCIIGLIFIYGYNLVSAILRGMGDSKHPFLFIAIASIINIILDLLFVRKMNMGPFGAALGTVISQAFSFIFAINLLYRRRDNFNFDFKLKHFKLYHDVFPNLLSLGIPMVIQSAAVTFSMLFVNSYVNTYGVTAVAVTGISRKIESVLNIISQAVSSSGGAMISQALGANKINRVPKVVYTALIIMFVPASLLALLTVLKPQWLFGLFTKDASVLTLALSYIPVSLIQYLGGMTRPASFALINGSSNSKLNLSVAILDGIIARIGFALLLGVYLDFGIKGFWYGNALAGMVPFLIGTVYLLSGKWKNRASINSQ